MPENDPRIPFQSVSTWRLFEDLVRRILEAHNFQVNAHIPRGDDGFDFSCNLGNERWAVEVKFYRTMRAQPTLIEKAATRLVNNGIKAQAMKGMLIVSCILTPELREVLENKFSVTFVDQADLMAWTTSFPTLAEELDALLEADTGGRTGIVKTAAIRNVVGKPLSSFLSPPNDYRGSELCKELRNLKRGRAAWLQYEKICEKILKYLFPNDLHGWHSQLRTDDGLNRYDFVCRVRPTTEFWKFVIDHLDSRYVLFEFKNYAGKIKQGQILTTEKYLLERGLRRVGFVMTRAGADAHAYAMTQGAMRESGKLLLILDDDKVCEMLHMKERGEDPTDCLFEMADNFLLKLPR